jgi:shikimate kinase
MRPDKIYLVGFMACGKSTVARALGARLGWRAEDVDDLIEARERRSIADIFAAYGEPYFRRVEREIVKLVLPLRHVVVATGGGTFADAETRSVIVQDGVTVWIDVPLAEIAGRMPLDGSRPLTADRTQFERLFTSRAEAYRQAHIRVPSAGLTIDEVVDHAIEAIERLDHLPPLVLRPDSPSTRS